MLLTGKSQVLGEKPLPMLVYLPQIALELAWDPTLTSAVNKNNSSLRPDVIKLFIGTRNLRASKRIIWTR